MEKRQSICEVSYIEAKIVILNSPECLINAVCKSLHHITIPHLYKSLVFTPRELSLSSLCMQIESVEWDQDIKSWNVDHIANSY